MGVLIDCQKKGNKTPWIILVVMNTTCMFLIRTQKHILGNV